jgi:hypothetical protein
MTGSDGSTYCDVLLEPKPDVSSKLTGSGSVPR